MNAEKHTKGPWHAVEYSGMFMVKASPYYDMDDNLLDREDFEQAEEFGRWCVATYNHNADSFSWWKENIHSQVKK